MNAIQFICTYCDHRFEKHLYTEAQKESARCPVCNDPDLKVDKHKMAGPSDVYGYRFSPEFPVKLDFGDYTYDLNNQADYGH